MDVKEKIFVKISLWQIFVWKNWIQYGCEGANICQNTTLKIFLLKYWIRCGGGGGGENICQNICLKIFVWKYLFDNIK